MNRGNPAASIKTRSVFETINDKTNGLFWARFP